MQLKVIQGDIEDSVNERNIMRIYDIEYDKGIEIEINFRIVDEFDGISQIVFNNCLYFCGAGRNDNFEGSYFLRYDPMSKSGVNLNILINAVHHHYLPTMVGYKNEFILVIGGENCNYCEIFCLKSNKWRILPELPEERFKCSAIADDSSDWVYLFGGYNSISKRNCSSVLRLNMRTFLVWETILVKNNSYLLARNSCGIIKFDKYPNIYLIGGKDDDDNLGDCIIEYDISTKTPSVFRKKLDYNASFIQHTGVDLNKMEFYLFDENYFIHKITKADFKLSLIDFKDYSNNYENIN
jgi:hypothetical protein